MCLNVKVLLVGEVCGVVLGFLGILIFGFVFVLGEVLVLGDVLALVVVLVEGDVFVVGLVLVDLLDVDGELYVVVFSIKVMYMMILLFDICLYCSVVDE